MDTKELKAKFANKEFVPTLEEIDFLEKEAEKKNVEAEYLLGDVYGLGRGVEVDPAKSFISYLRAAEEGHAEAMTHVGFYYFNGVPGFEDVDEQEAEYWFKKAYEKGDVEALRMLGLIHYQQGDEAKSFAEFLKAAEEGCPGAMCDVGFSYDQGLGVEEDKQEALKWYLKAIDNGYVWANSFLAAFYEEGVHVEKDEAKAFACWEKTLETGIPTAYRGLGRCYELGIGTPIGLTKALELYEKGLARHVRFIDEDIDRVKRKLED